MDAGKSSQVPGSLKAKARRRLEALVRRRSPAHWKVTRARIVLLSHKGNGIDEIARALSVDHQVVRRWLKRHMAHAFDGLKGRPKTGRPTEIEPEVWQKLTTLVVQSPEKFSSLTDSRERPASDPRKANTSAIQDKSVRSRRQSRCGGDHSTMPS